MAVSTLRVQLREILRKHPDGTVVPEMARITGRREGNVYNMLRRNAEFWIDRWELTGRRGAPRAVWKTTPADCPKPRTKK